MQQTPPTLPLVDRVIVHVEQMSLLNPRAKVFAIRLGKELQKQVSDVDTCIVKLSNPQLHRATGPVFHFGSNIVTALNLTAVDDQASCIQRKRVHEASHDSSSGVKR
jgi:hypothetical protein